jgi:hypothetical protein
MAIKGKSKTKGSAKTVTRGPKPAYVPVKKPLLQRRGFWITALVVVVVLSVIGIWYGIARQQTKDREAEQAKRLATVGTQYQVAVDPVLATVGQALPPTGFEVMTDFENALTAFVGGSGTPADLQEAATSAAAQTKTAAGDLDEIDAVGIVRDKGFDDVFVLHVLNAQTRMVEALKLYEQSALLAQQAAQAEGDQATELAARSKAVLDVAKQLFAEGYQDYVEAQFTAGVLNPQLGGGLNP